MTLSGGMKRRVMIAKALSHEPEILFLDEPTAGVDVELRRDMWALVRGLRERGVTIILTTHYIEEAEEMADRIGIINKGELISVEEKAKLMQKLGKRQLTLSLQEPLPAIPAGAGRLAAGAQGPGPPAGVHLRRARRPARDIPALLRRLGDLGIGFKDLHTKESSLEEIFVNLVHEATTAGPTGRRRGHEQRHDHGERRRRGRHRQPAQRRRPRSGVQPPRRLGHLPLRDGPLHAHPAPERGHPGDHHVALLRGVRVGHRLAHVQRRRACPTAPSSCPV